MGRKTMITKSLSKGVLGMKFMQKSKDVRDQEEEKKKDSHAALLKNFKSAGVAIKVIDSYKELEDLGTGRVSFKGMNPQVEKIMRVEDDARIEAFLAAQRAQTNQPEISDEAMADTLSKNMKNKFNTKKRNKETADLDPNDCEIVDEPVKKPKFLKPAEDD